MQHLASSSSATSGSRAALPCLLMCLLCWWTVVPNLSAQALPQPVSPRKAPTAVAPAVDLPPETPLALYDGGSVTFGEYQGWLRFLRAQDDVDKRSDRIAALAVNEVQAAKARSLELQETPAVRMAQVDFEGRLLHEALRKHIAESIRLQPEELDRQVKARAGAFERPRRVRLRNLLKRYPDGSDAATVESVRQEMESLRQQVLEGADFALLAERESDSQSRFRGGKIGWVRAGQMAPDVERIALNLKPGDLSEVIPTGNGFTLLLCEAEEDAYRPPEDTVRNQIKKTLRKEIFDARWQELVVARVDAADIDHGALGGDDGAAVAVRWGRESAWTVADVAALLQLRGFRDGAAAMGPEGLNQALNQPLEFQIAAQEARRLDLHLDPALESQLHWFEITTLTAALERQEIQRRFKPLETAEIRAYYEAHRQRYRRPAQTRLAAILAKADRDDLPRRFRQSEAWAMAIHDGSISFEDAVRRYSEHPSADAGGELGWLERTQIAALGPNVLKTVEQLKPGQVSGLVQQPEGVTGRHDLWIVKVLQRRPAKMLSYEEAAKAAENGLGAERTRTLQGQIRQEVIAGLNLRPAESVQEGTN